MSTSLELIRLILVLSVAVAAGQRAERPAPAPKSGPPPALKPPAAARKPAPPPAADECPDDMPCPPGVPVPCPAEPPCEEGPCLGPPGPGLPGLSQPGPPAPAPPEDPPPPVVTLQVRVPASVVVGREVEYRILVENRSAAAAHHVLVRNPLPANARFVRSDPAPSTREPELIWKLGTLAPGTRCDILLVLKPTGTDALNNCTRVQFEHGECVTTKLARPALKLEKRGPREAVLRDTLKYELEVTNTGDAEADDVEVSDTLPAGLEHAEGKKQLSWRVGMLPPGESRRVGYEVTAAAPGRQCNRAVATGAGGLRREIESCVVVAEPRLALAKTGPDRAYVNVPVRYRFTVSNPGEVPLREVVVTDVLPAQTAFVEASDGGQYADNQVRWQVGALGPGASRSVEVTVKARAAGQVWNRATAAAERGLSAQAEAGTEFVGVAALLLEVIDSDDPVAVDEETNYVILVRNQGSAPAENVRVEALVPKEMAVGRVTGPVDSRKDGQKLVFEPLTIPANSDARFVVYVTALEPGDVRFKVDLFADVLTAGPVREEESTTIFAEGRPPRAAGGEGFARASGRAARTLLNLEAPGSAAARRPEQPSRP